MEKMEETYLSDWLAQKITDEELKQLVSEEDFLAYQKIKKALSNFEITNPDLEHNFSAIKEKLTTPKTIKPKTIPLWRYVSVAACLLVMFGIYHFFIAENTISTDFGQTQFVALNDGTKVALNAKSTLCYSNAFRFKRTLQLEGEAFFEVQKGSPFTVKTTLGEIQVLGTKFNVIAFKDFFEVMCYEGKVKVTHQNKSTILTHGESVRFYNGTFENWAAGNSSKPSWISGESSFKNVPIEYVIEQLKNQYHIEVKYPNQLQKVKFTGTFTHKNLEVALQTLCVPLHLKFTRNSAGTIIISE